MYPSDSRPPCGLTTTSPPYVARPVEKNFPTSPFSQKPNPSMVAITVYVKQSYMHATSISAGVSPVFSQIFGPAVRENISVWSSHSGHPEPPWEFDDPTNHVGGCLQSRAMSSPVIRM